jgi:hypothetical protein
LTFSGECRSLVAVGKLLPNVNSILISSQEVEDMLEDMPGEVPEEAPEEPPEEMSGDLPRPDDPEPSLDEPAEDVDESQSEEVVPHD